MVDQASLPWWQAASEHKLTVQRCDDCQHCQLPPAPICPNCRSSASHLQPINGKGTLYTYTILHRPVAMDQELPFIIAIVELDMSGVENANGVRMMTNLVEADVNDLPIGGDVEVAWETMSDEVSIPRFKFTK